MKRTMKKMVTAVLIILLAVVAAGSLYTVHPKEYAARLDRYMR